jgi:hypothetical protein
MEDGVTVHRDDDASSPRSERASELVQRLRMLRWPEVTPDVRQRCWEELSRQVTELTAAEGRLHPLREATPRAAFPPGSGGTRQGTGRLEKRRFGAGELPVRRWLQARLRAASSGRWCLRRGSSHAR